MINIYRRCSFISWEINEEEMKNQKEVSQWSGHQISWLFLQIVSVYWDRCWGSALN